MSSPLLQDRQLRAAKMEVAPAIQVACSRCDWRSSTYAAAGPVWRDWERKNAVEMAMEEANGHAAVVHGMKRAKEPAPMTHPLDDTYDEDCETCGEVHGGPCGERYYDDEREDDIFGECLYPKECVMPGDHMPSECHTAEMYEAAMEEMAAAAGPKPEDG